MYNVSIAAKVLRPGLIKGPWTKEEDDAMIELVKKHGIKSWSTIARQLKGRLEAMSRRWHNHLNPDICKSPWTPEEDSIIMMEHKGSNKWVEIAKLLLVVRIMQSKIVEPDIITNYATTNQC